MKPGLQTILKALSDESRLKIVSFLSKRKEASCGEVSVELSELTQPTISHHFKVLADANVIQVRKEGVACYYSVNKDTCLDVGINIDKMF